MTDSPAPEAPAAPRRSSARNILTVMTGTLASRVLGLVRQLLFNLLFPLPLKDAFNVAYRIPNLFRELLAEGALVNAIIPVYKSLDPAERARFAGSLTTALFAANALVVGLGVLFAREVVWAVEAMAGLSGQASSLDTEAAVLLTRIMMPFLSGISFAALAMALLNSEERFSATAFSPLAFSVVSIAGFLAFPGSAVALAWVTTLGGFAQLLVQVPALRRHGLLPSPRLAWHPALGRTLLLMAPFAFTTGTRQFLTIILQALLIRFPTGAVTGFNNADAVFQLFLGLFAVSPALASYPRLSEQAQRGEWPAFRDTVSSYLRLILFLCLPGAALLFALAPSVVGALYNWGSGIEEANFRFTREALGPLALAIVPWGLSAFLARTFYARERARDAIVVSVLGFLVNTALYYALQPYGFVEMNLATTVTGWLFVGVYLLLLRRQVGLALRPLLAYFLKVLAPAAAAGVVAWVVSGLLPEGRGALVSILRLAVAGGAGAAVFLALALALRVPELRGVTKRLLRR